MNIAFDMFFAKTEAMKRGIGRYSQNMIEAILNQDAKHTYYYFYPDVSKGAEYLKDQLQQFLYRNRIDVYHMTSPFNLFHLPANLFQAYSDSMLNKAWFGYTRVAATLYDVIPLVLEKQYMNDFVRPIYMRVIEMIRSCDIIYAISETTKQDAVRLAGIEPEKISVIMGGYDPKFKVLPKRAPAAAAERYGIVRPYVLCTGGDDPRKNLARLIEAFIGANRKLSDAYQLVIVYNSSATEKSAMLDQASRLGAEGALVITGYVADDELVELYNGAALFAFPSLYEGFGLPIVEAMACGASVLTSNNSSLAEIGEDKVYQVDPESLESIADGLVYLLTRPLLLQEMAEKGLKQARKYNWETVALKVMEGYEKVYRRKIAVFAPRHAFYPQAYGTLYEAVPYLTNRSDVDVYVEQVLVEERGKARRQDSPISVYPHTEFEQRKGQYEYVLYELGNEERYAFLLPYLANMADQPGIVVLTEEHLHERMWKSTIEGNDLQAYYRGLAKEFGLQARQWMNLIFEGKIARAEVPLYREYLDNANFILAYSRRAEDKLAKRQYRRVLHAPAPANPGLAAASSGSSPFLLASVADGGNSFPFPCPIVLKALGRLAAQGDANFRYTILSDRELILSPEQLTLIEELGLRRHIRLKKIISIQRYKKQLARTDAAIALFPPGSEGAPDTVMELAAGGIPTIVADSLAYEDFPADVFVKIPTGEEAEDALLQALTELYRSKDKREALSERAKAYMHERQSLPQFAEMLQDAIDQSGLLGEAPTVLWRIQQSPDGVPSIRNI
ncbi:glycosyltransferase [Cohnella boryungensis]|uniref:Glycosyltransferase n=1 Tax=Cohnella boryungensis TaxID=768479 RepID=A0ABV8SBE5_9BACL